MRPTQWRSLSLTLAVTAVIAGCGKDSNDPDPDGNNAAPAADFSSSCAGLSCTFTDLSADSDGQIASYAWDFGGDGGSDQRNPTHTFAQAGEVSITLTVTDDAGAEDAAVKTVTVTLPAVGGPAADFGVSCSSLECTFQDLSTHPDGTIVSWAWEFGDGSESSEQNPVHHYDVTERTLMTATLTVSDGAGLESTKTTEFTVSPAATLQCESAPGTGQFASCALELLEDATVTVSLDDRSCDAHGNSFPDHRADRGDALHRRLLCACAGLRLQLERGRRVRGGNPAGGRGSLGGRQSDYGAVPARQRRVSHLDAFVRRRCRRPGGAGLRRPGRHRHGHSGELGRERESGGQAPPALPAAPVLYSVRLSSR